jgi:hypothetical protein
MSCLSISFSGIGDKQEYIDVTGQRSANTIYKNETLRPIFVYMYMSGDGASYVEVSKDGVNWVTVGVRFTTASGSSNNNFIVPVGHYYRMPTIKPNYWVELR